jgi:hypothetical protein
VKKPANVIFRFVFPLTGILKHNSTVDMVRKLDHFKKEKGYAVFCPVGELSFDEMAELVSCAIVLCRRQKINKLLIDSTELHGFHAPVISERYNLAERMAQEAASLVKIAHVASPEWVRQGNSASK